MRHLIEWFRSASLAAAGGHCLPWRSPPPKDFPESGTGSGGVEASVESHRKNGSEFAVPTSSYPPSRVYRSPLLDSTRWNSFEPRHGDIVISTATKAGTTWAQRIVASLIFQSVRLPRPLMEISPWLDMAMVPLADVLATLSEQRHRRFVKTHLPLDALPFHPHVRYVVVGRDLRDLALSTHHHARSMSSAGPRAALAAAAQAHGGENLSSFRPPEVPEDVHAFWREFFTRSAYPWESDGWPYNSPTRHLSSWWEYRSEPNIRLLHYQDMLDDLDGEMRRLAEFLGITVDERVWPDLVHACTFAEMKVNEDEIWDSGLSGSALGSWNFFHKGTSGQWRTLCSEDELALHDRAVRRLPEGLRTWLVRDPSLRT
ncbi:MULTISPECIES: sulfotransferase domain-containing protein [unclassified Streptomyces]|uniref:sulfotransferase domain-containing protein n=1 Tax=unclassified Streptomyces TaxID=2593676 RepID=UPI00381AF336